MSLGFLTESALLPSKAKKINVDSRSMLDLKAIVYEKEDQAKQTGGESLRKSRGRQATGGRRGDSDVFQRSNKGVHARNQRDEEELETMSKKQRAKAALERKAALYDKLQRGEIEDPEKHGFLVNFERKGPAEDTAAAVSAKPVSGQEHSFEDKLLEHPDMAEITDEFGRTRVVHRRSQEYAEHLERERGGGHGVKRQREETEGQAQWPVSSGHNRDECGDWAGKHHKEGKGMLDFGGHEEPVVVNGRVKSRWDVTLSNQEKEYLKEIAEETEANRAAAPGPSGKKDPKADRRELLRKKAEARKRLKQQGK